jgi:hypothetical protein
MKKIFKALIIEHFEDEEKRFVVSLIGSESGGPIICSNSIEEAKSKFIEALKVMITIQNLFAFERDFEEAKKNWIRFSDIDVEYHHTVMN